MLRPYKNFIYQFKAFNNFSMRKTITLVLIVFITMSTTAQRPGGGGRGEAMPAEGVITGTILEYLTDNPMGYANVVLFSQRDSSMVSGTVTNMDGSFQLDKVPNGKFYLIANFIGFKRETIPDIAINPRNPAVDLSTVYLHSASEDLEAVEIVGQQEHIEYQIDRRVVNVSQDLMAQGGTAVTALENTPSVQVDIDGNVSLRGSGSFTVLVDGRPSVLQGSDALQQIPSANIDRIEIITNPSAKYDPDGVAGIINVILKEKKQSGLSGIINLSAGTADKYNGDFLLNYRTGKFNVVGGADFRDYNSFGGRESFQETDLNDSTTRFLSSIGDRNYTRGGYNFRVGTEYFLNDKTTISVMGQAGVFEFERTLSSRQRDYTIPASTDDRLRTTSISNRERDYYRITLNFQHQFDDLGHKLEAMAYYSYRDGTSFNDQEELTADEDWNITDDDPFKIKTNETSLDEEIRFNIDYTRPISENGRLEAGYQTRMETEIEDYRFTTYDFNSQSWIEDDLFSNDMDYRRDIHSIYGMYSNIYNSLGYQLGLRSEYTYRKITNRRADEPSLIDRWDIFPTLHLSYTFPNNDQMQASYTKRINRPRGWALDPFTMYIDSYSRRKGNPNLKPEYTDSYELAYQKRINGALIALEGYYRVTTDQITRIRTLESDGTFLYTFENINNDYSLGSELMVNVSPAKWFDLSVSGNLFHYRIEGNVADSDIDSESLNWNGNLNATFNLPNDFRVQANGRYNGPTVRAQGESKGFFMSSLALRKDFFNRQFSVTASIRDIFGTARWESISSGPGFTSNDTFIGESQVVTLNLTYIINNYKRQRGGMDGNGDMDMGGEDL
jgi:outer membrane receptor protein involved in Fe transport